MLNWKTDRYVILAGDAAAAYAGRAYDLARGRWETVSGGKMTAGSPPRKTYEIRSADVSIQNAAGNLYTGIRILCMTMHDAGQTEYVQQLFDGIQSSIHTVNWVGKAPLGAGIFWRVQQGGLIAGDIVWLTVSYD